MPLLRLEVLMLKLFLMVNIEVQMKKLKITQIKSGIGKPERQKRTLQALGLRKMNQSREVVATPQVEGMINKVKHLIKIEEV